VGWVNNQSFKNDRKLRRAALLANYRAGFDTTTYCLTLYAVWCYVRKSKANMHGFSAWKGLLMPGNLLGPNTPFWMMSGISAIYNETMFSKAYNKINKTLDQAGSVHKVNNTLNKTLGVQLPKSVGLALAAGSVSIDSHFLDPFFNHMTMSQYLQAAFARANEVGDGSYVPDKDFLLQSLSDGVAQYAYASLYSYCKESLLDCAAIGVIKTEKPRSSPKFESTPQPVGLPAQAQASTWISGIAPRN